MNTWGQEYGTLEAGAFIAPSASALRDSNKDKLTAISPQAAEKTLQAQSRGRWSRSLEICSLSH
jgi:hypothetical protein